MLNLSLTHRFWKIFSTTWLWKISMWPLYYHHILAAGKLRRRLKGYYNNAINMRIYFDGYGSKIQKVNRCRPTVSNETILAIKKEFLFTKVTPVKIITDIVLLGFWLTLPPWMAISSYTIIYFFVKNFFSNVYISGDTIFECSYLFFLMRSRLSTYATGAMEGGHPKDVQVCTCGEGLKNRSLDTYVLNEWPQINVAEYFLCTDSAKYTRVSQPTRKVPLFSFIIITIILSYALIRI